MLTTFALLLIVAIVRVQGFAPSSRTGMVTRRRSSGSSLSMDLEYKLENAGASCTIRTYGGNVFSYKTKDGIEVMGKRKDAPDPQMDAKPWAGGNPHCFPQFGPGELPQHGFARGSMFVPGEKTANSMTFKLLPTSDTKAIWDHNFEYAMTVTLNEDSLDWDVVVKNNGEVPFDYTHGLHTYYDISSMANIKIDGGFKGKSLLNRLTETTAEGPSDTISISEPIDSMWTDCNAPITITDSGKGTKTTISRTGYTDTCVWSPFGDEKMGWDNYVCVEPVCASKSVTAAGGSETKYSMKVSCEKI